MAPSSRRNSIGSQDGPEPGVGSRPGSREGSAAPADTISAYERSFPSFFVKEYTTIAPINRCKRTAESLEQSRETIEESLVPGGVLAECSRKRPQSSLQIFFHLPAQKRPRGTYKTHCVKDLVIQINGSANHPIDLTDSKSRTNTTPHDLLCAVPIKYLHYAEDVRPPYIGTYTKLPLRHSASKLCRNPFTRALPAMNYDYDSEAEWEEPEEGEELNSEGEEELGDEDDADDMDGFLDDEETEGNGPKRRHLMGDIQPVCTSLHWEGGPGQVPVTSIPYGQTTLDLAPFRFGVLLGRHP